MKKKNCVIYTSLVGGYDTLCQPQVISDNCDYICYSNDISETHIGVWEIRKIPYDSQDNSRLSRFVKLNPHIVLSEYNYSVWVDSNIQILDGYLYERVAEAIENDVLWGAVKHPDKNCIYEDARSCACGGNESFFKIYSQCLYLKSSKYPDNNGLYENNVIFRRHNCIDVINISEQWWSLYLRYSKRDQLSLCYVFWRNSFTPSLLFPPHINTWDKSHFRRLPHKYSFMYRVKRRFRHVINSVLFRIIKF